MNQVNEIDIRVRGIKEDFSNRFNVISLQMLFSKTTNNERKLLGVSYGVKGTFFVLGANSGA